MPDDDYEKDLLQVIKCAAEDMVKFEKRIAALEDKVNQLTNEICIFTQEKIRALEATINDRFESIISDYKSDETENWKECAIKRGNITKKINELAARIDKQKERIDKLFKSAWVNFESFIGVKQDAEKVRDLMENKERAAPDTTEPLQDENGFCIKCPYNFVKRLEPFVDAMEWIPQFLEEFEEVIGQCLWSAVDDVWQKYRNRIKSFLAELGGETK